MKKILIFLTTIFLSIGAFGQTKTNLRIMLDSLNNKLNNGIIDHFALKDDQVVAITSAGDTITVYTKYDDRIDIDDISGLSGFAASKLEFIVDTTVNAPSAGDSILTHNDFVNKHLDIWRGADGDSLFMQYRKDVGQTYHNGYSFQKATGTIVFTPHFETNEHIIIHATDSTSWTDIVLAEVDTYLTNLVAYYPFEQASGALNDTVGTNDATNTGGATYRATGIDGYCLDFERDNSNFLTMADAAELQMYDQDFTFVAWVNLESGPTTGEYASVIGGESSAAAMTLYNTSDKISLRKVATSVVNSSYAPVEGSWTFIAITFNSTLTTNNVTFYINSIIETKTYNINFASGAGSIYIGSDNGTGSFWDGLIDEVMIWKGRILTADEIADLYNDGNGLFYRNFH